MASLTSSPPTGTAKCFNTLATCQDTANIDLQTVTLRFAKPTSFLPRDIDCLPWIESIDYTSATVSIGEDLGQRASLRVKLKDYRHSDTGEGFDKYFAERGYDPYQRGSFWPRFRARHPSLQGAACRWRFGFVGDAVNDAEMQTYHMFIESYDGPDPDGTFTIIAKDALKLMDGDRAQVPLLSNGSLVADITDIATSATLTPTGIGNAEYPASGYVRIGGNEDCIFSRAGDVLTLTRAQFGTVASAHSAGDRVQLIRYYPAYDPANLAADVILNFTSLPASYITLADWQNETATYLGALYTFVIGEPTPVATILSRLIQQAGLAMWDDPINQKLRMKVIRAVPVTAGLIDESLVIAGSFDLVDQPDRRVSQAWVYYGLIDASKGREDPDNYRSTYIVEDTETETIFGYPAIRKIFADGIAQGGNSAASRVGNILVGRSRFPPRRFTFSQMRWRAIEPKLGDGYNLSWRTLQDASGARETVPIQIVRLTPGQALLRADGEEMRFNAAAGSIDPNLRMILIDSDSFNLNLRTIHDALYPSEFTGVTIVFILSQTIGSASADFVSVDVGTWPSGVVPIVVISGRTQGAGGKGGASQTIAFGGAETGYNGGVALYTRSAINLVVSGSLYGGGGGGGGGEGAGGGGGAGIIPGPGGASPNFPGNAGTADAGGLPGFDGVFGTGSSAGAGGDPGQNGANGDAVGGTAGAAIDGVSFVTLGTWGGSPATFTPGGGGEDILGPQIN